MPGADRRCLRFLLPLLLRLLYILIISFSPCFPQRFNPCSNSFKSSIPFITLIRPCYLVMYHASVGMATDWLTKTLYWTDNPHGTIEVSRYNGSYRTTLIEDNVLRPRSIAIDPVEKYNFMLIWNAFNHNYYVTSNIILIQKENKDHGPLIVIVVTVSICLICMPQTWL